MYVKYWFRIIIFKYKYNKNICLWECLYFDRIKVYVFENKFFVFGCGMLVILFWFVNVEFFVEVYNFLI